VVKVWVRVRVRLNCLLAMALTTPPVVWFVSIKSSTESPSQLVAVSILLGETEGRHAARFLVRTSILAVGRKSGAGRGCGTVHVEKAGLRDSLTE